MSFRNVVKLPTFKLHLYDIPASLASPAPALFCRFQKKELIDATNGLYWLETFSSLTRLDGFPSHPTLRDQSKSSLSILRSSLPIIVGYSNANANDREIRGIY